MCERTTIASLMDNPIKPTAPTKPINPKFALPTKSPKNASPVHKIATLKIIPASLKELSAEINAITIKTKKIVAEEKSWAWDSDLDSASPDRLSVYPGGNDFWNDSMGSFI